MEALGHMFMYFLRGSLPWQGLKKKKGISNITLIGEVKMCTSLESLCSNLPSCFAEYIKYCRKLKFDETPDYKYLRVLFQNACIELNIVPHYEWNI